LTSLRTPGDWLLAEGDGWVVVAKPPGLLVHRNERDPNGDVALQRLRDQLRRRVYAIHRLDRPTSGCLLFATRRERAAELQAALTAPEARKTYVALVRGALQPDEIVVDTPMKLDSRDARAGRPRDAVEAGVSPASYQDARTHLRVIARSDDPRCSLVLARPETGRFHQVRRHLRDLSHPVLADSKHGDSRVNRAWRERGLHRLALHCLSLDLPAAGIHATCPLFEDHAAVLRALPFWEAAVAAVPALGLPPLAEDA